MKIYLHLALGLIVLLFSFLCASEGGGGIDLGIRSLTDIKDLNSTFTDRYGKNFGTTLFQLTGEGYGVFGGFAIGGEGTGIYNYKHVSYERPNDVFLSGTEKGALSISGGYGALNLGWQWRMCKEFNLLPMGILGYGGMEVDANPINSGVSTSNDTRRAEQGCFVVGAKVLLNYHLILAENRNGYGGLKFALVAGYSQWVMPTGWDANHVDLDNLPNATLSGAYLMLSIGGVGGNYGGVHKDGYK